MAADNVALSGSIDIMNEQAAKPAAPTIDFPAQVSEQAMGRVFLEGKCLNGAIVKVLNWDGSVLATARVVGGNRGGE